MIPNSAPSRRSFLKRTAAVASGLVLGFHLPGASRLARAAGDAVKYPPNAFIRIAPDESVTIVVGKLEFGQGVLTSLPMLIAEELECDWSRVKAEHAPVAAVYNHPLFGIQLTGGSQSVASSWDQLRTVGAQARTMLVAAAAQRWNTSPAGCRAENGFVIHVASGRLASFGSLAEAAMRQPVPAEVTLKPMAQWKLLGKPTKRIDAPAKGDGSAVFGMDFRIPGMAVAMVARPPEFGATVARFDATAARAVKGVIDVLQVPTGIAVIAADTWAAKQGRDVLEVTWNPTVQPPVSTEALRTQYRTLANSRWAVAAKRGDVAALADARRTVSATYEMPYLAHAPMEPLNCLVDLSAERCRIWSGTQFQTIDVMNVAQFTGLKTEQIEITTLLAGGGFGRRATPNSDYIVEAVQVARAALRPVKAFVMETMIDELAAAAGRDPLAYRLALLAKHPRHTAALELAAAKAGWGRPRPKGRALGIAVHESFGSVVAQVAEVSTEDGRPKVHKITTAIHCGFAVNPLGVEAQVQSAVAFGLSAAMSGAITLKDRRVQQSNFHDYPVLRMPDMPEVEVHIVPSTDAPTGVGEPATPPVAPAVANAFAAVTGKRLRALPFAA